MLTFCHLRTRFSARAVLFNAVLGCCAWSAAPSVGLRAEESAARPVDFNRDIRPILAHNCYHCHGPDAAERKADLRLDTLEGLFRPESPGVPAVTVQGHPQASELFRRISSPDAAERMPPADSQRQLSEAQIALIERWIEQGADWGQHWSFVRPIRPAVPEASDLGWVRNPIDAFILAQLDKHQLSPSPEADRLALVRRLYLDLIGLPPTPEEADAFVADQREDAYEQLVDRLLKSPHYGERWARLWLDLARYSDSNGYEKDRPRSMWPYRDWVVAALNRDMPFDQFTIEQIAGDMLPGATLPQRVATGFHRNTMTNEEGGIDFEEFRFASIVDRVNTTGTAWLGLTVGCAQCHAHKFDPISQTEYYQLLALLDNVDEPELEVPDERMAPLLAAHEEKVASIERQIQARLPKLGPQFADWRATAAEQAVHWTMLAPSSFRSAKGTSLDLLADGSLLATGDAPNDDVYELLVDTDLEQITALRLEVLPHDSLPDGGPGRAQFNSGNGGRGDFLLTELEVTASPRSTDLASPSTLRLKFQNASETLADKHSTAAQAVDGDIESGWAIGETGGQMQVAIFPLAEPLRQAGGTRLSIRLVQQYIHQLTIGRFRLWATGDERQPAALRMPAEDEALLLRPFDELNAEEQRRLQACYALVGPELAPKQALLQELHFRRPKLPTTLVMAARPPHHTRTTHRRHRGDFLSPREAVAPGVPSALHPLPPGTTPDRLALARWLVDEQNPLVGRVTMNRQWQALFGRGIVRTSDDFGVQGELPSHPELLDWLATEFIRRGWSLKAMHRLIVTSATYRQSSRVTSAALAADPGNVWLARAPRVRLEAELVRDMLLAASGQLNREIGGRSVFPPQPDSVVMLAYGMATWTPSTGPDRYRRGLYIFNKRTSPFAGLAQFDGPSGETCVSQRDRTDTPLQALTLLNDGVYVEAAQALARRSLAQAGTNEQAIARRMFRLCLTRPPEGDELSAVLGFYRRQLARFRAADAALARQAIGAADTLPIEKEDACQQAAWTLAARVLLNLDETITKE
ncbi:MAG: PSD1 and planctomycete cytochrome C domain-containing protein [Pirellulales bacterium]